MKKINYFMIFLIVIIIFLTFILYKTIYVLDKQYNIRLEELKNPNVKWLFDCNSKFLSSYYKCPNEIQFQNMTGLYCNNTLLCKNEFILVN